MTPWMDAYSFLDGSTSWYQKSVRSWSPPASDNTYMQQRTSTSWQQASSVLTFEHHSRFHPTASDIRFAEGCFHSCQPVSSKIRQKAFWSAALQHEQYPSSALSAVWCSGDPLSRELSDDNNVPTSTLQTLKNCIACFCISALHEQNNNMRVTSQDPA